jgi:hypothetical protein
VTRSAEAKSEAEPASIYDRLLRPGQRRPKIRRRHARNNQGTRLPRQSNVAASPASYARRPTQRVAAATRRHQGRVSQPIAPADSFDSSKIYYPPEMGTANDNEASATFWTNDVSVVHFTPSPVPSSRPPPPPASGQSKNPFKYHGSSLSQQTSLTFDANATPQASPVAHSSFSTSSYGSSPGSPSSSGSQPSYGSPSSYESHQISNVSPSSSGSQPSYGSPSSYGSQQPPNGSPSSYGSPSPSLSFDTYLPSTSGARGAASSSTFDTYLPSKTTTERSTFIGFRYPSSSSNQQSTYKGPFLAI